MKTESAEIPHEERHSILIAMARICGNVGDIRRFCGDDSRSCLPDGFLGGQYFRVRLPCDLYVFLTGALVETRRNSRVQFDSRIQRKSQKVLELGRNIRHL